MFWVVTAGNRSRRDRHLVYRAELKPRARAGFAAIDSRSAKFFGFGNET
jgi:hypothetical protein